MSTSEAPPARARGISPVARTVEPPTASRTYAAPMKGAVQSRKSCADATRVCPIPSVAVTVTKYALAKFVYSSGTTSTVLRTPSTSAGR